VSKLRFTIAMSLDGFVAGPNQSVENPIGVGGMRLHEWVFPLRPWRTMQGMEGGEVNESSRVVEESFAGLGATIIGRNMFGGHPGPWDAKKAWNGWWGDNPPYHHPVFVLTHHPRAPLGMKGATTFTFVTEAGGAKAAQQYLVAGLVDEMLIHLVPVLLGSGERLFERLGDELHGLKLIRTVAGPSVIHLKFAR
jgi:dihydrofolate reductase